VSAATLAMLAWSGTGRAQQLDLAPPVPNVLLLLDNSGSMERMIDGTLPEQTPANTCNCTGSTCDFTKAPPPNRWGNVQQALTGQLTNGYNCVALPRTAGLDFDREYSINGTSPYDVNYTLPFHRMVAKDTTTGTGVPCVIAPGILPGALANQGAGPPRLGTGPTHSADEFVDGDIIARQLNQLTSGVSTCVFAQQNNGTVSSMSQLMRFGLMTFDTDTLPNIGVASGGVGFLVSSPPFPGMWSYFPGWDVGGTPPSGRPANCTTAPQAWAVGARNPAAPPWEGRMVRFPATSDPLAQQQTNSNVADVIRASRPYGATPLAGMLAGAEYYFWTDPKGPQQADIFVQGDCRPEFIILLTDGAPNQDMRPDCEASLSDGGAGNGICPFAKPEDTVAALWNNGHPAGGNQFVKTYVIGFAVSKFDDATTNSTVQCSSLVQNNTLSSTCATATPDSAFAACCELEKIAIAGGSTHAFFADTPGDLQSALASILAEISKGVTTRTVPAYSPVVTNVLADPTGQTPNSEVFFASFAPTSGAPWTGDVMRSRFFCPSSSGSSSQSSSSSSGSSTTVTPPGFNPSAGDDFAQNMNTNSPARTFIAMEPATPANAGTTLRPFVASTVHDGLATDNTTAFTGSAGQVITSITPDALNIPLIGASAGCPYTPNNTTTGTQYLDPTTCRNMLLDFTFGAPPSAFSGPGNFTFNSRFGNALGDIYHATPIVVGPPGSLLQDPSYQAFRALCSSGGCGSTSTSGSSSVTTTGSQRPTIVYAATNDGLLHAFWADETTLENNERWAMLLPAAMPNLKNLYPAGHQFLLDGTPIVKDTVWDRTIGAQAASVWHTTLVAGYGRATGGYYAVDVTDPDPSKLVGQPVQGSATVTPPAGPVFRWQLMPTANNNALQVFGKQSATPAVTTLFMDPGDGNGAREIGVAILPGGSDGLPTTTAQCGRSTKVATDFTTPPTGYATRTSVRCWGSHNPPGATPATADPVDGRSVSIVRLDTGEVLRTFMRSADLPSTNPPVDPTRVKDTPFDSPMTGTPIVFPVDVGADATKAFITDADGTLWRIDLSSPTPTDWKATLFLDLYNTTVDTNTTTSWQDGQPTSVDPVLSLDPGGRVVLNIATGTTDTFDNTGTYFVYSITEQASGSGLVANVNWFLGAGSSPSALRQGERVSGPMTVFNGTLFFATYFAGSAASLSCTSGDARVWGMDFVTPFGGATCTANPDPCRGNGGVFSASIDATHGFIDPGATNPGRVIPGVAIQATPACGSFATRTDGYVAGVSHMTNSSYTPGSYALVMPMSSGGGARQTTPTAPPTVPLQTPLSPTLIDSWAAVLE
jgi:type IV pilus assembly protein PilY1